MRLFLSPRQLPRLAGAARLPRRTVRLRLTALYGGLFLVSGGILLVIVNLLARSWPGPPYAVQAAGPGPAAGSHGSAGSAAGRHQLLAELLHQRAAELNQLLAGSAIALGVMAVASVALGWLVAGRVLRPLRTMTAATRAISEDNLHRRLAVPGPGDELKDLGDTIDALLARLEAAFDAQRNFVANASHELRTPLTLGRTLLQIAITDPRPTVASYRATCLDLLEASDQQEQLIEALLTLARSQCGLDHRDQLDLTTIVTGVLHSREQDAAARDLTVDASLGAALVLGDDRLIRRLVANLIDNAIRHNVPGGRVTILITSDGGRPRLRITNTGPVVEAGQVARLIQPFQRLGAARHRPDEGLGLGLAIVAAVATAHHATLTIDPGRNGGLVIDVSFPPPAPAATGRQAALTTT